MSGETEELKVGDTVRVNEKERQDKQHTYTQTGSEGIIKLCGDDGYYNVEFYKVTGDYCVTPCIWYIAEKYLTKIDSSTKSKKRKEVNTMKLAISKNYSLTEDALLVEKHLGGTIGDSFIDGLIVEDHKDEILAEAQRLEKEELARKK